MCVQRCPKCVQRLAFASKSWKSPKRHSGRLSNSTWEFIGLSFISLYCCYSQWEGQGCFQWGCKPLLPLPPLPPLPSMFDSCHKELSARHPKITVRHPCLSGIRLVGFGGAQCLHSQCVNIFSQGISQSSSLAGIRRVQDSNRWLEQKRSQTEAGLKSTRHKKVCEIKSPFLHMSLFS